jgi:uncharacterized SAM-binding protein YcdF (DUF218 family)
MFFLLSKILGFFALPSNLLITLGLLGAVMLLTRYARLGRRLLVASVLLVAVAGLSPLGNILILPLEQRFPPWDAARGSPDGIVVLGGPVSPELSLARGEVSLNESAERVTVVAELARRYPQARIVYSGGNGGLIIRDGNEAEFALRLFQSFGIDPVRILAEDRSRNTFENAVFSKQLAAPKPGERWLLVTSAHHMPRSIAVFRQAGFGAEAYPVDYRTRGWIDAIVPFGAFGDGLRRTDTATREWIGLIAYWVTGKSSVLFPSPRE